MYKSCTKRLCSALVALTVLISVFSITPLNFAAPGEVTTAIAPKSIMTATANNNESSAGRPGNVLDDSPYTMWHTIYSGSNYGPGIFPIILSIDMGRNQTINRLDIYPRDGAGNGQIRTVEIWAGDTAQTLEYVGTYSSTSDNWWYADPFVINIPDTNAKCLDIRVTAVMNPEQYFCVVSRLDIYTYDIWAAKLEQAYFDAQAAYADASTGWAAGLYDPQDVSDYKDYLDGILAPVNDCLRTGSNQDCYDAAVVIDSARLAFLATRDSSTDADIISISAPRGAALDLAAASIACNVPYPVDSQAIDVAVKEAATWALFSDAACTSEIADKTMNLVVGENTAYLKVTSQYPGLPAVEKIYTVAITRADNLCDVASVTSPPGANIYESSESQTILCGVENSVTSMLIDVTVAPGAVWGLYSDETCLDELVGKTMENLREGTNIAYIKVTNGARSKVYTLVMTRAISARGNVISVLDYGASPNSGTDTSAAIQAAIDAAGFGDTVYMPDGEYSIRSLTLKSGIELRGESREGTALQLLPISNQQPYTIIKIPDNSIGVALKTFTVDAASVMDLTFPAGQGGVRAVNFDNCKNILLNNLLIRNFPNNSEAILGQYVEDVEVSDCIIRDIGIVVSSVPEPWACAFRLRGSPSRRSKNIYFLNNWIDGNGRGGLLADGQVDYVYIIGNKFTRTGYMQPDLGIAIEASWYAQDRNAKNDPDFAYTPHDYIIEDNDIDHWLSTGGAYFAIRNNVYGPSDEYSDKSDLHFGAEELGIYNGVITDSKFKGPDFYGISLGYGNNMVVANSDYENGVQWGMQASGSDASRTGNDASIDMVYFYNVSFNNNEIDDVHSKYHGDDGFGIRLQRNTNFMTFDSCRFINNGRAAVNLNGFSYNWPAYSLPGVAPNPQQLFNVGLSFVNCLFKDNGWGSTTYTDRNRNRGVFDVAGAMNTGFELVDCEFENNNYTIGPSEWDMDVEPYNNIPYASLHNGFDHIAIPGDRASGYEPTGYYDAGLIPESKFEMTVGEVVVAGGTLVDETTVGVPVTFTSLAIADADKTIDYYLWDFGEGVPVTTKDATYTYKHPGVYKVMLTVWDNMHRGHISEQTITVLPSAMQEAGVDIGELERLLSLARNLLDANPGYPEYNKNRLQNAIDYASRYVDGYAEGYVDGSGNGSDNGSKTPITQHAVDLAASYIFAETVKFYNKAASAELIGIEVAPPLKTEYLVRDTLDLSGLKVTAQYSGQPAEEVYVYVTDPVDGAALNAAGALTVMVSYSEDGITKSGSFYVNVNKADNTAYVSITGPASVATGAGATATYVISADMTSAVSGIELEFEVDGDILSSNSFSAEGGFAFFGDGNYGTPILWKNAGSTWTGKVTLLDMSAAGIVGAADILNMVFNVREGAIGFTEVKLNYIKISFKNGQVATLIMDGVATTILEKWYSLYDLNKDGVIDLNDLTFALQFLLMTPSDPEWWDGAYACDYNHNDTIDIDDLILILANYTIPYYS